MKAMKIMIVDDGREFEGTPVEIVEQMKFLAWGMEDKTIGEYIEWMAEQMKTFPGVEIDVSGGDDASKAERFVRGLLENGVAVEVK